MNTHAILIGVVALMITVPVRADDGWYRFPTALEGKWKIAKATTGDQVRNDYVDQIAEINGSSIVLRTDTASNTYRVTYVSIGKSQIELDLTAARGQETKTFRCLLTASANELRLIRPQNDSHPRPQDIDSPDRSETLFTLVPVTVPTKP